VRLLGLGLSALVAPDGRSPVQLGLAI
jgi:hypothetical protein